MDGCKETIDTASGLTKLKPHHFYPALCIYCCGWGTTDEAVIEDPAAAGPKNVLLFTGTTNANVTTACCVSSRWLVLNKRLVQKGGINYANHQVNR